ncbi:hypothetical protein [Rathayibacter sp. VKM Ac-2857]|uniref:hypothetical protein n=1 Tax=Rathayibacter sp. VKM Ac-2857 TaxID=2739020 RepID=UPI0015633973|nr:hypothetical protein [Rathayibacter sp. VKM Ac-2857]NQX18336.1 hypothetical protein [Rathayibacter sp. VKM Ac-2857]
MSALSHPNPRPSKDATVPSARDLPLWVHQARKEPQMAVLQGRVFEIGSPDVVSDLILLTVWQAGRPIGHILRDHPLSYRSSTSLRASAPQPVQSIEDLLSLLTLTSTTSSADARRTAHG